MLRAAVADAEVDVRGARARAEEEVLLRAGAEVEELGRVLQQPAGER